VSCSESVYRRLSPRWVVTVDFLSDLWPNKHYFNALTSRESPESDNYLCEMKSRCTIWRKPLCLAHNGWKFFIVFFHSCDVCRYAYSYTLSCLRRFSWPSDKSEPRRNLSIHTGVSRPRPFLVSCLQYTFSHTYSYTNTYIYLEWYCMCIYLLLLHLLPCPFNV